MIYLIGAVLFLLGFALPPALVEGEPAALVATFFGLLAAGILPALSIISGFHLPEGFSVAKLNKLAEDTERLEGKLYTTLGLIICGGVVLVVQEVWIESFQQNWQALVMPLVAKYGAFQFLVWTPLRLLQAVLFTSLGISLDRMRLIAVAFSAVRRSRFVALESTLQALLKAKEMSSADVATGFSRSENFGKNVKVVPGKE